MQILLTFVFRKKREFSLYNIGKISYATDYVFLSNFFNYDNRHDNKKRKFLFHRCFLLDISQYENCDLWIRGNDFCLPPQVFHPAIHIFHCFSSLQIEYPSINTLILLEYICKVREHHCMESWDKERMKAKFPKKNWKTFIFRMKLGNRDLHFVARQWCLVP